MVGGGLPLACCQRRADSYRQFRVKPITVAIYKKSLADFTKWLDESGTVPAAAEQWDDAVVAFCKDRRWGPAKMTQLINGLELVFPRFRRCFHVSRAEAEGLQALTPIEHKVPLTRGPASLFAAHASAVGLFRIGIGIIVQQGAGLRPSELLGLLPEHVLEKSSLFGPSLCLRLGALVGTKARREQVAFIYSSEDPLAYELLTRAVSVTIAGSKLFPFTYAAYNSFLREATKHFCIDLDFTAHSLRAGFASERIARGENEVDVQRRGRWKVPASFSIYVDVILASQVEVQFAFRGLSEAMVFCNVHLLDYFPISLVACDHGSKETKALRHARANFGKAGPRGAVGLLREGGHQVSQEAGGELDSAQARKQLRGSFDFFGPPVASARGRLAADSAATGGACGSSVSAAGGTDGTAKGSGKGQGESQGSTEGRGQAGSRLLRKPPKR